jgi:hypothetical protein
MRLNLLALRCSVRYRIRVGSQRVIAIPTSTPCQQIIYLAKSFLHDTLKFTNLIRVAISLKLNHTTPKGIIFISIWWQETY